MKDFEVLAKEFDVKGWMACVNDVVTALSRWPKYAKEAHVSPKTKTSIQEDMSKTRATLWGDRKDG